MQWVHIRKRAVEKMAVVKQSIQTAERKVVPNTARLWTEQSFTTSSLVQRLQFRLQLQQLEGHWRVKDVNGFCVILLTARRGRQIFHPRFQLQLMKNKRFPLFLCSCKWIQSFGQFVTHLKNSKFRQALGRKNLSSCLNHTLLIAVSWKK